MHCASHENILAGIIVPSFPKPKTFSSKKDRLLSLQDSLRLPGLHQKSMDFLSQGLV